MLTISNQNLGLIATILAIIISLKTILSWHEKKTEERNSRILDLIDKKLDKKIYEKDQTHFKELSDDRDRVLNERINKLENDIRSDLVEINDSLKLINEHMLNCNKRIG